jgi:DNA repair protein RadC
MGSTEQAQHGEIKMQQNNYIKNIDTAVYVVNQASASKAEEDEIIERALTIARNRLKLLGATLDSPKAVEKFFTLQQAARGDQYREVFSVVYLDAHNKMIEVEDIAVGSISQCMVYPREVVRSAPRHNATGVVLCHNHPGGSLKPSMADEKLTSRLKEALSLVDVAVLDHIIVGAGHSFSFAENGLM